MLCAQRYFPGPVIASLAHVPVLDMNLEQEATGRRKVIFVSADDRGSEDQRSSSAPGTIVMMVLLGEGCLLTGRFISIAFIQVDSNQESLAMPTRPENYSTVSQSEAGTGLHFF